MPRRDPSVVEFTKVSCNQENGIITGLVRSTDLSTWAGTSRIVAKQQRRGKIGLKTIEDGTSNKVTFGGRRSAGSGEWQEFAVDVSKRHPDCTKIRLTVVPAFPRSPEHFMDPCGPAYGPKPPPWWWPSWIPWPGW